MQPITPNCLKNRKLTFTEGLLYTTLCSTALIFNTAITMLKWVWFPPILLVRKAMLTEVSLLAQDHRGKKLPSWAAGPAYLILEPAHTHLRAAAPSLRASPAQCREVLAATSGTQVWLRKEREGDNKFHLLFSSQEGKKCFWRASLWSINSNFAQKQQYPTNVSSILFILC